MKTHFVRPRPKQKLDREESIGEPCLKCHRPITRKVVEYFKELTRKKTIRLHNARKKSK